MRKSLGEKRREISPEQVEEITRLHGAFTEGDLVKIVDNESFGYRAITVEQPLRGYWQVGPTTWDGLEEDPLLTKLDDSSRAALIERLRVMDDTRHATEADFLAAMGTGAEMLGVTPAQRRKLATRALVRDAAEAVVVDKRGQPIPDPDRRDTENVPLGDDVEAYLESEVRPHISGAWCSDPAGKIGYEIPFTRLFYKYTPPRPSAEIKAELTKLEGELHRLLAEVVG